MHQANEGFANLIILLVFAAMQSILMCIVWYISRVNFEIYNILSTLYFTHAYQECNPLATKKLRT